MLKIMEIVFSVWCNKRPNKANIKTLPYPGFPTDLQPQMGVVLSISKWNKYY